ncbi:penicillin-binding protein [Patescibacteria group bacterium]
MYRRKKRLRIIKFLAKLLFICLIIGILGTAGIFAYFAKDLPDPTKIGQRQIIESTKIFDRTGQILLYDIHGEEKRTIIEFDKIPQYTKDATIVIEDDNFYRHFGLDFKGIIRAAITNFQGNKISQGGSTITQQYIKNAFLGGSHAQRTFTRKIKEAILTLLFERKYSKDEILSFYLNQVPYGSNAYGIESASQTFFNKSTEELTLAESTLLAALPQAPSYYSPYGSHPDELKNRQNYILDRMVKLGYITEQESEQAKQEKLKYTLKNDLKAYHFIAMIREYLENKYGHLYADINSAGLKVYTTLDWDLQKLAEEIITEKVKINEEKYNATNAALVSIDPKTGQLLCLVGSKDYSENQFNVATSPHRQPGSSFKPFAYAAAFKKGYTPETIIYDLETNFGKFGPPGQEKEYIPQNYDTKFRGPVTMKQGLSQSLNIPSVKTLYLAGIDETIKLAQDMGITTLQDRKSYGLSLVLGGGEVKLLDETAAYSVFANDGIKNKLNMILKIEDNYGNILEEYKEEPEQILTEQIARQINSILSDEDARAPMMGSHSKLYLPNHPAAAKTGTTQDYSDGWTIGYTPSLTTGVWAGNNDFAQKMKKGAAGLYVAAPIWNDFMVKAYDIVIARNEQNKESEKNIPNQFILPKEIEEFVYPEKTPSNKKSVFRGELDAVRIKINKETGQPAEPSTPIGLIEEKIYTESHSILYYSDLLNDQQFSNWEESVLRWAQSKNYNQMSSMPENNINDNLTIKIISPDNDDVININSNLEIKANTGDSFSIKQVDFFFDNQLIGSDNSSPYSINFNASSFCNSNSLTLTQHNIKARVYNNALDSSEDIITIYIK